MSQETTILIADDARSSRLPLRWMLEEQGFTVLEAETGEEALALQERRRPDIVILDVRMPGMSGLEVCRTLRRRESAAQLPILFITGLDDESAMLDGFTAGGNDYITKPINKTVLFARLHAQLALLQASRAIEKSAHQLAQKRRMEMLGVLAGGVAHNFNNILGTVMGSAELIAMLAHDNEDAVNSARLILSAAKRGAGLVEGLLTFSRPAGNDQCERPNVVLKGAVAVLAAVTRPDIRFHLEPSELLPPVAMSCNDLSHVLSEVLKNAVEAINGAGDIYLSASLLDERSAGQPAVRFTIRDTGRGIAEGLLDHVFEPFYSTKNVHAHSGLSLDGSGLGLSSVYNLVNVAGGTIRIAETGTNGTTVEIELPVREMCALAGSSEHTEGAPGF